MSCICMYWTRSGTLDPGRTLESSREHLKMPMSKLIQRTQSLEVFKNSRGDPNMQLELRPTSLERRHWYIKYKSKKAI